MEGALAAIAVAQVPPFDSIPVQEITMNFWTWLGTALLQTVVFTAFGTWWVAQIIRSIRDEIATERKEVDHTIAGVENDMRQSLLSSTRVLSERLDEISKEYAIRFDAVRADMHSFEKWSRDEFVRRDDFSTIIAETKLLFRDLILTITERLDRLEKKIDRSANVGS